MYYISSAVTQYLYRYITTRLLVCSLGIPIGRRGLSYEAISQVGRSGVYSVHRMYQEVTCVGHVLSGITRDGEHAPCSAAILLSARLYGKLDTEVELLLLRVGHNL